MGLSGICIRGLIFFNAEKQQYSVLYYAIMHKLFLFLQSTTKIYKQLRGKTKALHVMVIANDDVLDVYIYFFGHLKPSRAGSEKKTEETHNLTCRIPLPRQPKI